MKTADKTMIFRSIIVRGFLGGFDAAPAGQRSRANGAWSTTFAPCVGALRPRLDIDARAFLASRPAIRPPTDLLVLVFQQAAPFAAPLNPAAAGSGGHEIVRRDAVFAVIMWPGLVLWLACTVALLASVASEGRVGRTPEIVESE